LTDLLFDGADCRVACLIRPIPQPSVVGECARTGTSSGGPDVLVGIEFTEIVGDFLQQVAPVIVGFPRFNPLPGDIEGGEPGDRVSKPFSPDLARGQKL